MKVTLTSEYSEHNSFWHKLLSTDEVREMSPYANGIPKRATLWTFGRFNIKK